MSTRARSDRLMQRCPGCGRLLRIPPELKGQKVACKFCNHMVHVQGGNEVDAEHGLTHVGTGTAFQIERTWTSSLEKEARFTVIRHPLKQGLKGYTMAIECYGPARVHVAGIKALSRQAVSVGRVRAGEARVMPIDDLSHAYLWLEKGATATVKVIVGRTA